MADKEKKQDSGGLCLNKSTFTLLMAPDSWVLLLLIETIAPIKKKKQVSVVQP